jgi:hypothetical protein
LDQGFASILGGHCFPAPTLGRRWRIDLDGSTALSTASGVESMYLLEEVPDRLATFDIPADTMRPQAKA